jgi:hypothetical protein
LTAYATVNGTSILAIAGGAIIVWLALSAAVAEYGRSNGYSWWGLFLSGVFLSWALVLLAVTIGVGNQRPRA